MKSGTQFNKQTTLQCTPLLCVLQHPSSSLINHLPVMPVTPSSSTLSSLDSAALLLDDAGATTTRRCDAGETPPLPLQRCSPAAANALLLLTGLLIECMLSLSCGVCGMRAECATRTAGQRT